VVHVATTHRSTGVSIKHQSQNCIRLLAAFAFLHSLGSERLSRSPQEYPDSFIEMANAVPGFRCWRSRIERLLYCRKRTARSALLGVVLPLKPFVGSGGAEARWNSGRDSTDGDAGTGGAVPAAEPLSVSPKPRPNAISASGGSCSCRWWYAVLLQFHHTQRAKTAEITNPAAAAKKIASSAQSVRMVIVLPCHHP
jgi:hypothetical protein